MPSLQPFGTYLNIWAVKGPYVRAGPGSNPSDEKGFFGEKGNVANTKLSQSFRAS